MKISQLSKNARRRVKQGSTGRRVFARRNGKAGWKLRFVSKGYEGRIFELIEDGYEEVKIKKEKHG
jgi:hypothetical protein